MKINPSVWLVLFFTALGFSAKSQILLDTDDIQPPNLISPCGSEQEYCFTLKNTASDTVENVLLTYDFAPGINYLPGSVFGAAEHVSSQPGVPVFFIEKLPPGNTVVCFYGRAGCEASANATVVHDEVTVSFGGNSFNVASPGYNVKNPALAFTSVTNLSYQGVPGETYSIGNSLTNNGFGEITELTLTLNYTAANLTVTGASAGTLTNLSPAVLRLTGADFASAPDGDGDSLFETGETISLEWFVKLLVCSNSSVTLTASWGCGGEVCEEVALQGNVLVSSLSPQLTATVESFQFATLCEEGYVRLRIVNKTDEGEYPGAGAALHLTTLLNFSDYSPTTSCLPLFDFQVGDAQIPATTTFSGHSLSFASLATDPDGAGGLSDEDSDGFYDDLAAGETLYVDMKLALDAACLPDCQYFYRTLKMYLYFKNRCNAPGSLSKYFNEIFYKLDFSATEQIAIEHEGGSFVCPVFNLWGTMSGGFGANVCPLTAVLISLQIPPGLEIPPGFSPTFNGVPLPWTVNGNIIQLTAPNPTGKLEMCFLAHCDELEIDPTAPCASFGGDPQSYQIKYWMEVLCNDGCGQPLRVLCDQTSKFIVACPHQTVVVNGGVVTGNFTARRDPSSLGYTDATMSQQVSPATPGLAWNRVMPGDLVEWTAPAEVFSTDADNLSLTVSYFAPSVWFEYDSGELQFFDSGTGQWHTCADLAVEPGEANGFRLLKFELWKAFAPGGCFDTFTLTTGDRLLTRFYTRATKNLPFALAPVPGLKASYSFDFQGATLSCSSDPAGLEVLHPAGNTDVNYETTPDACDEIEVVLTLRQYLNNLPNEDPFPFEWRPFFRSGSPATVTLPVGCAFVPGSVRAVYEDRTDNTATGALLSVEVPLSNPQVTLQANGTLLTFDAYYPVADLLKDGVKSELRFKIIPSCPKAQYLVMPQAFPYVRYAYSPELAEALTETESHLSNYFVSNRKLLTNNLFPEELTSNKVRYRFYLDNFSGKNTPFNYLDFVLPPGVSAVQLQEILSLNSSVVHPLISYGSGDAWAQIGTHQYNSERHFELTVCYETCQPETLLVRANFQCGGYPGLPQNTTPGCEQAPLELSLFLTPKTAALDVKLTLVPPSPSPLCQPLRYEATVVNLGSKGFDVAAFLDLPQGAGSLVPGSCWIKWGNNAWISLPDPVSVPDFPQAPGVNRLLWASLPLPANNLPGSEDSPANRFVLAFEIVTDCEHVASSQILVGAQWLNGCGSEGQSVFISQPLELEGAPSQLNQFLAGVAVAANSPPGGGVGGGGGFPACAAGQTIVTFAVRSLPGNAPTGEHERLILLLPEGLEYQPGTFFNLKNMPPGEPALSMQGNRQQLEWQVPPGILAGDTLAFGIALATLSPLAEPGVAALPCDNLLFSLTVVQAAGIPCASAPQGFCKIDFVETAQTLALPVLHPKLEWQAASATAVTDGLGGEHVAFDFTLQNPGELAAPGSLTVQIFGDDGDGIFEKDEDQSLGEFQLDGSALTPGSEIDFQANLNVPGNAVCNGYLFVLDPSANACFCEAATIFIPAPHLENAGASVSLCDQQTHLPGAPSANPNYLYEWSPVAWVSDAASAQPAFLQPEVAPGEAAVFQLLLKTTRPGGCVSTDTVSLTIARPAAAAAVVSDFNGYSVSCAGSANAEFLANAAGGTPPYNFTWSGNLSPVANPSGAAAGIYFVTVTDAAGCTATAEIIANEPPVIQLIAEGLDAVCHGIPTGSAGAAATGGVAFPGGNYVFSWSNGSTNFDTGGYLPDLPPGVYYVTVTDANGCSETAIASIGEPPALVLGLVSESALCNGSATGSAAAVTSGGTAFPGGNYAYSWSNGSTSTGAMGLLLDVPAGTYSVTVTDSHGCEETGSVEVQQPPALALTLTPHDTPCAGGKAGGIGIEVSGGTQPYEVQGNVFDTVFELENLAAGNYQIVVTDANGCTVSGETELGEMISTFTQTVQNVLCHGGSDGMACIGEDVVFGGFTVKWSTGQTGECIGNLVAGNYGATVTDGNGCEQFFQLEVEQPAALQALFLATNNPCFGDKKGKAIAVAQGGTQPFAYLWNDGSTSSQLPNLAAGFYQLTLTDAKLCTWTGQVEITQPPALQAVAQAKPTTCFDGKDGEAGIVEVSGGVGSYQYHWETGAFSAAIFNLAAGNYAATVADGNGCEVIVFAVVGEPPPMQADIEVIPPSCPGKADGEIFIQSNPPGEVSLDGSAFQNEPFFEGLLPGSYTIWVRNSKGCVSKFQAGLQAPPTVLVQAFPTDTLIEFGESVELQTVTDPSVSWLKWSGEGISCDSCPVVWVKPWEEQVYTVSVGNPAGCTDSKSVRVRVSRQGGIYIPNVFSPNGDGVNDVFLIFAKMGVVAQVREFQVFSRWGEQVFRAENFQPNDPAQGWDGWFRGQAAQVGVYVWVAEVEWADGLREVLKGGVTVVR